MISAEPMWIEVTRGGRVESRHRIDAVVCDSSAEVVAGFGNVGRLTQPRSAVKPIQALPLVTSGAGAAFDYSQVEYALACASHSSEPGHIEAVLKLLERVGSGPHELECGPHLPGNQDAAHALVRSGIAPGAQHNNCSGKHAGFLATAHHLGENPSGYTRPNHPVQIRVRDVLAEMASESLDGQDPGIDGCGIPVWTVSLVGLATAWARLADPGLVGSDIGSAATTLLDSMVAEPWYVAGTDRSCTRIIAERGPRVVAKTGAEGVYCAVDRDRQLGMALKTGDGAKRGSQLAIEAIISHVLGESAPPPKPVYNVGGTLVGEVRVASM